MLLMVLTVTIVDANGEISKYSSLSGTNTSGGEGWSVVGTAQEMLSSQVDIANVKLRLCYRLEGHCGLENLPGCKVLYPWAGNQVQKLILFSVLVGLAGNKVFRLHVGNLAMKEVLAIKMWPLIEKMRSRRRTTTLTLTVSVLSSLQKCNSKESGWVNYFEWTH